MSNILLKVVSNSIIYNISLNNFHSLGRRQNANNDNFEVGEQKPLLLYIRSVFHLAISRKCFAEQLFWLSVIKNAIIKYFDKLTAQAKTKRI